MRSVFCLLAGFLFCILQEAETKPLEIFKEKTQYLLKSEPIDVVIPCAEKDARSLELCIEGIQKNGKNIRRIIVVSAKPLTRKAEWFDENNYPFKPFDLALQIFGNQTQARAYLSKKSRIGWIYQQFLKLYAPFVIPEISSNVLVLDADTIFLNPVEFLGPFGGGLYNPSSEHHPVYFAYMARLLPGLKKVDRRYSGISHHMLFQKSVLEDLFNNIQIHHGMEPWKALCKSINRQQVNLSCLSEYEIYFNFAFARSSQMKIRPLKWKNLSNPNEIPMFQQLGYHYVSCHVYEN